MFSLSGQTLAAARVSNSPGVGASVTVRCPCSIHSAAAATAPTITARPSFKSNLRVASRGTAGANCPLRMEPPLPEIINQVRDRQDRQQPHQDQGDLPGYAF